MKVGAKNLVRVIDNKAQIRSNGFDERPDSSPGIVQKQVSFKGEAQYKVVHLNPIKKVLPYIAFVGAAISSIGYFIGSAGLFYDSRVEKSQKRHKQNQVKDSVMMSASKKFGNFDVELSKVKKNDVNPETEFKKEEGVKTIKPITKIGKISMKFAKVGVSASAISGMACGLGEGIPTMAIGEATNLGSASIIETPIGTGLFGIGIASIFSALALDNTPELKLNYNRLMAEKTFADKAKLVTKNIKSTVKEVGESIWEVAKNIYKPSWLNENFLQGIPKVFVFTESINKEGKVFLAKALRHNKNYMTHAASFTLALGGVGVILASLLKMNKSQKGSLKVEEGGFLFDNLGMTRYGMDKYTTGGKSAGSSFAVGGVINAISQFMGLDNKDGRAMQWLGISFVFGGFAIDRGLHLKKEINKSIMRGDLTDVVREWKFDLSKIFKNNDDLKALKKAIKTRSDLTIKIGELEAKITKRTEKNLDVKALNAKKEKLESEKKTVVENMNPLFKKIEEAFGYTVNQSSKTLKEDAPPADFIKDKDTFTAKFKAELDTILKNTADESKIDEIAKSFEHKHIAESDEMKSILERCTEIIFGKKKPDPLSEDEIKKLKK